MTVPDILVLASGLGERFKGGDKLMADLGGQPVLAHTLMKAKAAPARRRYAMIGYNQPKRGALAQNMGFDILTNAAPEQGQGTAIALATKAARANDAKGLLIMLGDMPFVSSLHLMKLIAVLEGKTTAVMSEASDNLLPPAIFSWQHFNRLEKLNGDKGAKALFKSIPSRATLSLPPDEAIDIDTQDDLSRLNQELR